MFFTAQCRMRSSRLLGTLQPPCGSWARPSKTFGLNNGPSSLVDILPDGWQQRVQLVFSGKALILRCLGRTDFLMSKLFALCDRGIDIGDCVAMAPTAEELGRGLKPLDAANVLSARG